MQIELDALVMLASQAEMLLSTHEIPSMCMIGGSSTEKSGGFYGDSGNLQEAQATFDLATRDISQLLVTLMCAIFVW